MSFGDDDAAQIAADASMPLPQGHLWPRRRALAEELARPLRAVSPNVRTAARADGRADPSGRVEAVETGSAVVWVDIRWLITPAPAA